MIDPGTHVKLLLVTNTLVEGIVENWSEKYVKLKSLDNKNILIIHHASRDIVLTKIVVSCEVESNKLESNKLDLTDETFSIKNNLEEKNDIESSTNDDFKHIRLVKLRSMLIDQEKKIVSEKLKHHHIEQPNTIKYETIPSFLLKKE